MPIDPEFALRAAFDSANWYSEISVIAVVVGIFIEFLALFIWSKEMPRSEKVVMIFATFVVMAGCGGEWLFGGRATSAARQLTDIADNKAATANREAWILRQNAAITEERLLGERRLTARERMRLERVERAVLPRSFFVNWPALIAALKVGKFPPVCITSNANAEPREFALNLSQAFTQAGNPARFLMWPSDPKILTEIEPGVKTTFTDGPATALSDLLWQKFQIGAVSISAKFALPSWKNFPRDMPCIIVGDNDSALQPSPGQPGEGIDKYGGPDPAPH